MLQFIDLYLFQIFIIMGGCLVPEKYNVSKPKSLPSEDRKLDFLEPKKKDVTVKQNNKQEKEKTTQKKNKQPPIKEIREQQIFHQFEIVQLLNTATTLQGPKLIMNRVNGTMKACRIIRNATNLPEARIIKFKEVTKSELYRIGEYYIMVSQLLTGPTLVEYLLTKLNEDCTDLIKKVCDIIKTMHDAGIYHGNLTFDSFRFVTQQCKQIKLCEINVFEKGEELLNVFHKNTKDADWEFVGLLISVINDGSLPYYSRESLQYKNLSTKLIESFLQGKSVPFQNQKLIVSPLLKNVYYAYLLRMNIFKLMKIKQKRKRFEYEYFYDVQSIAETHSIKRPIEDIRVQIQRQRITERLKKHILPNIQQNYTEQYLKIPIGGLKLNEFKSVFKIQAPQKKFDEILYKLVNILT